MSALLPKAVKPIEASVRQLCANTGREQMQNSAAIRLSRRRRRAASVGTLMLSALAAPKLITSLELRWLEHRQVRRFRALEYATNMGAHLTKRVGDAGVVAH